MPIDEREEDAAHREAEQAVVDDRTAPPPVSDTPGESPVERRPGELEQTPVRHES